MGGPQERLRQQPGQGRLAAVAGGGDGGGLRIDTTGLRPAYLAEGREPLLSPGNARALRVPVVGVLVLLGLLAVTGDGGSGRVAVVAAVGQVAAFAVVALGGEALARALDRTTRISPTHLDVRPAGRRRVVPWDDVRELEPPGRFGDGGRAHLADGTTVPLPHVSAEDVGRLGAAIEEARRERRRRPGGDA